MKSSFEWKPQMIRHTQATSHFTARTNHGYSANPSHCGHLRCVMREPNTDAPSHRVESLRGRTWPIAFPDRSQSLMLLRRPTGFAAHTYARRAVGKNKGDKGQGSFKRSRNTSWSYIYILHPNKTSFIMLNRNANLLIVTKYNLAPDTTSPCLCHSPIVNKPAFLCHSPIVAWFGEAAPIDWSKHI